MHGSHRPYSKQAALALVDFGWVVSVVNPARIKGFAMSELARNKTDRADAALLARFCAAMRPSVWTPPSPAYRQLRALVERSQALKDMRQQEANRLEAHHASGETTVLPNVKSHIAWLDKQIAKLRGGINDHIDGHPELKQDAELIASIPGIGETTVAKVLAYAGDVRRFANAKALAAFIGICPRQRQSGRAKRGGEAGQGAHDDLSHGSDYTRHSTTSVRCGMKRHELFLNHVSVETGMPHPDPVSLLTP